MLSSVADPCGAFWRKMRNGGLSISLKETAKVKAEALRTFQQPGSHWDRSSFATCVGRTHREETCDLVPNVLTTRPPRTSEGGCKAESMSIGINYV